MKLKKGQNTNNYNCACTLNTLSFFLITEDYDYYIFKFFNQFNFKNNLSNQYNQKKLRISNELLKDLKFF